MRSFLPLAITLSMACQTAPLTDLEPDAASAWTAQAVDDVTLPDSLIPPPGTLALTALDKLTPGGTARVVVFNATPGAAVALFGSLRDVGTQPVCPTFLRPVCLDLVNPAFRVATGIANARGTVVFQVDVPANAPIGPVTFQAGAAAGTDRSTSNLLLDTIDPPDLVLTVLHSNDGESNLLPDGDVGGIDRFVAVLDGLQAEAALAGGPGDLTGAITVTSGDNFLAGPEFNASLVQGVPFFDAIGLDRAGYDALCLGNHDFDFGPDVLADFISSFSTAVPFLSANLDVSAEPALAALASTGRIASSTVVDVAGRQVGIVGATTERLRQISSPRDVVIGEVIPAVQAEIDALTLGGADIIVLISHLQSIEEDLLLLPQLSGVDLAVAGGGDELLANADTPLVPGDSLGSAYGGYPLFATNADGGSVPVVTTNGGYRYVGRLVARFDEHGDLVGLEDGSGPVRVVGGAFPDAVTPDAGITQDVVVPVSDSVAELASTLIGSSDVALDGVRANVRTRETNQGNLIADAFLWQVTELASAQSLPLPDVALANGGGIRNDAVIPAGDLTELDTFDMLPFTNFMSIVPAVPRAQFKEILENAVSRVGFVDGRFAQVAGLTMTVDPTATAQVLDGAQQVVTPGARVVDVTLDDGTPIVVAGAVVPGAPVNVAIVDFLARGGDQYPFRGLPFTVLGTTYQQALRNFVVGPLAGSVLATEYPEGGEGRITFLP